MLVEHLHEAQHEQKVQDIIAEVADAFQFTDVKDFLTVGHTRGHIPVWWSQIRPVPDSTKCTPRMCTCAVPLDFYLL